MLYGQNEEFSHIHSEKNSELSELLTKILYMSRATTRVWWEMDSIL